MEHLHKAIILDTELVGVNRWRSSVNRFVSAIFTIETPQVTSQSTGIANGLDRFQYIVRLTDGLQFAAMMGSTIIAPLWTRVPPYQTRLVLRVAVSEWCVTVFADAFPLATHDSPLKYLLSLS
ncbi:MAG: hypothetical protein NTX48_11675 [Planctomycetales bacterium]|nr:hypothetical protein [Planctomycetales bacterium]